MAKPSATASASAAAPIAISDACKDLVPGHLPEHGDALAPAQSHLPDRLRGSVRGFDVSTPAPFKSLHEQGFAFSYVQAAVGPQPNKDFKQNWETAKACGFPRGAYQFMSEKESGAGLAKVMLDTLGSDLGELPPTLDLEKPNGCADDCCGQSCTQWGLRTREWIETVEKATSRKVQLYVVEPFYAQCLCAATTWKDHSLWLAAWPRFDFPEKPRLGEFTRWSFYQYEGTATRYGGAIDLDVFYGGKEDWAAFLAQLK